MQKISTRAVNKIKEFTACSWCNILHYCVESGILEKHCILFWHKLQVYPWKTKTLPRSQIVYRSKNITLEQPKTMSVRHSGLKWKLKELIALRCFSFRQSRLLYKNLRILFFFFLQLWSLSLTQSTKCCLCTLPWTPAKIGSGARMTQTTWCWRGTHIFLHEVTFVGSNVFTRCRFTDGFWSDLTDKKWE